MSHRESDAAETADGRAILFQFAYRTVPFRVVTDAGAATRLQAEVGTMPYTVDGPSLRHDLLTLLDGARSAPGYEIEVARDHHINLSVALPVDGAAPPASILAAAIERLAGAKLWLDQVLSLMPAHLRKAAQVRSQDAA